MRRAERTGRLLGAAVLLGLLLAAPAVAGAPGRPVPGAPVPGAAGGPAPAAHAAAPGVAQRIETDLRVDRVPSDVAYLPNLNGRETVRNGVVAPLFTQGPAPDGVASLGVSNTTGTPKPYVLNAISLEGSLALGNLSVYYMDNDAPDFLGAQLNGVLTNVTLFGNSSYTFWNQNVVRYSDRTDLLEFVDNIWNFSSPALSLSPNALLSYGPNGTQVGSEFYYATGPVLNISLPFSVQLYLNASRALTAGLPYDQVWFNYSVDRPSGPVVAGSYDHVVFASQPPHAAVAPLPPPYYQVNGGSVTPTGYIPYDAEMVLGGPGGGSTTSVFALNGTVALGYYVGPGRYLPYPSAVDFGSDTGETVEGVAEYYTAAHLAVLGAGPTIFEPFWNASPTAGAGKLTVIGQVSPAPAFAFLCRNHAFNASIAAWAPIDLNGRFVYDLPSGPYEIELLLAGYDPQLFAVYAANASTWNISATLVRDPAVGLDTPIWARSNGQVAALASSGNGTGAAPYALPVNGTGPLAPMFGTLNDFGFPLFPGILLQNTSVPVLLDDPSAFPVVYAGAARNFTEANALPSTNDLQFELADTRGVVLWGGTGIAGWFSPYLDGDSVADLMVWNGSSDLVANSSFASQGASALLVGGGGNVVWDDRFLAGSAVANGYNATVPLGLELYESGDRIFDNAFEVTVPALSPAATFYQETFGAPVGAVWNDLWNVSAAPATSVVRFDGRNLSGNLLGGSTVGGNYWSNYGDAANPLDTLPYTNGGAIATGGDYLPLFGPAQGPPTPGTVAFSAGGMPPAAWDVTFNGAVVAAAGGSLNLTEPPGRYAWNLTAPAGYTESPSSGVATVDGNRTGIALDFTELPPPVWSVAFVVSGFSGVVQVTADGISRSGSSRIGFAFANGSYPYAVSPVPNFLAIPNGTFVVAGPTIVPLAFVSTLGWLVGNVSPEQAAVTIDGGYATTYDGTFNRTLTAGSYRVDVSAPGYVGERQNVTVVAGSSTSLSVSLARVAIRPSTSPYTVTFAETGLAEGTAWTVELPDGIPYGSTGSSIAVPVPDGFYAWTVPPVADYTLLGGVARTAPLRVLGSNLTVPLAFAPANASVALDVNVVPATLLLDGVPTTLGNATTVVTVAPGNLSVEVAAPGFRDYFRNLTLAPNASVALGVRLVALPPLPPAAAGPPAHPYDRYVDLASLGLVLAALLIVVVAVRRRRPPDSPPPGAAAPTR